MSTTSTAELLLQLQGIDYQLGELERSKGYLPDMIENLKAEIRTAEDELTNTKKTREERHLDKKQLELTIEDATVALAKLKDQMTTIKTNREYDALSREIDHKKEELSRAEDELLAVMGELEELEQKLVSSERDRGDIQKSNDEQLQAIQSEMDSVGTKIKIKENERKNILVRLEAPVVAAYERIKRGKGSAVVAVRKRACSGCFKALPPQLVQEIRRGEQLITCDSCGRILIWEDED
jgi:predicted  nucleic acid-binding Zn-ribbon protein